MAVSGSIVLATAIGVYTAEQQQSAARQAKRDSNAAIAQQRSNQKKIDDNLAQAKAIEKSNKASAVLRSQTQTGQLTRPGAQRSDALGATSSSTPRKTLLGA